MSDDVTLPPRIESGASIDDLVRTIQQLQDYIQAREPTAFGGKRTKFLTIDAAIGAGLLAYATGGFASGPIGDYVVPGIYTSNPADASPPTSISGLTVSSSTAHYLIEIDPPTYTQGGGNGRTIIYGANYSGSGPLPTFANASERGTIPGRGVLLVIAAEPGVETRFWAKAETRHPTLQADPTGGTNGVGSTAELIEDQHIVSLTAAKLTAGTIGVSEYIQSTGFVSGSAGWRIDGNGNAEFSGIIVRGTIYATAGTIGGITISSTSLRYGQTAYDTGAGFWLGNVSGTAKFSIGNSAGNKLTWDGTNLNIVGGGTFSGALSAASGTFAGSLTAATGSLGALTVGGALTISSGGAIKQGQTAYDTGTGFWIGDASGTPKFSIGNSSGQKMTWDGSTLSFDTVGVSISGSWPNYSATASGGRSGYSYMWIAVITSVSIVHTYGYAPVIKINTPTSSSITMSLQGGDTDGGVVNFVLVCLVKDANGRVAFASHAAYGTWDGIGGTGGGD